MPRNGTGIYSLPQAPFVPNTTISSSAVNSDFSDMAAAMTGSVAADGQTQITGQMKGVSGTLTAPQWSFQSDASAGAFLAAVGKLGNAVGGIGTLINSTAETATAATLQSGGANYNSDDEIVLAGGTFLTPVVILVTGVSAGVITSFNVISTGLYTVSPSSPVSQNTTTGSGSGATFNVTFSDAWALTDLSGNPLWTALGATEFMSSAMGSASGLDLANEIGGSALAAVLQSSIPYPLPMGYLTPTSGTPIITGDVLSATRIFYTPFKGNWTPSSNGTIVTAVQFSEMSLTLTTTQAANNIYDIFYFANGGIPVIGTGPSWAAGSGGSIATGSCARGTGSGSTQLTQSFQGLWTNAVNLSLTSNTGSGNTVVTCPANQGVFLGSIYIDGTAGQATFHRSYGQNRKWSLSNPYNPVPIYLKAGDNTASWTNNSATIRPSNGNAANSLITFTALAEECYDLKFTQKVRLGGDSVPQEIQVGIGYNATNAFSGLRADPQVGGGVVNIQTTPSLLLQPPSLGINTVTSLEASIAGGSNSFFGTETNMVLSAQWRG